MDVGWVGEKKVRKIGLGSWLIINETFVLSFHFHSEAPPTTTFVLVERERKLFNTHSRSVASLPGFMSLSKDYLEKCHGNPQPWMIRLWQWFLIFVPRAMKNQILLGMRMKKIRVLFASFRKAFKFLSQNNWNRSKHTLLIEVFKDQLQFKLPQAKRKKRSSNTEPYKDHRNSLKLRPSLPYPSFWFNFHSLGHFGSHKRSNRFCYFFAFFDIFLIKENLWILSVPSFWG